MYSHAGGRCRRCGSLSALSTAAMKAAFLWLCMLALVAPAAAQQQSPLTLTVNGANPYVLECGMENYQELGATASGGTAPYSAVTTSGSVDTHEPGTYQITYSVKDSTGATATTTRTVVTRDTIAPSVDSTVAVPMLWPPNHNLINVGLSAVVRDACDESPTLHVTVFADEPEESQTGDGRHSPDAKGIGGAPLSSLRLRAERKGDADGRVYVIVVTATDDSGNLGYDVSTVVVPHSRSRKAELSVKAQAAAATARAQEFAGYLLGANAVPSGFFVIGAGELIGPKQ